MSRDESDSDNTQRSTFGSLIMDFRVPPPIAVAPSRGRGFDQSLPPPARAVDKESRQSRACGGSNRRTLGWTRPEVGFTLFLTH